MRVYLALPIMGCALMMAGAALAQSTIRPGETVQGQLTAKDRTYEDGSYYRCYSFNAQPNRLYEVTMASDDFDAFLAVNAGSNCGGTETSNDDGPDMGTNAQVKYFAAGGPVSIRANSLSSGEVGRFSLTLSEGRAVTPTRDILPIMLGASMTGQLDYGDRRADDGSFYDCYRLETRSADQIAIRMDSAEFDAYLGLYAGGQCEGEPIASDDDSGGGTSAEVVERLDRGTYSIRANGLSNSDSGAYVLTTTVRR